MSNSSNPKVTAEGRGHWLLWALAMAWVLFVFIWYFSVTHLGRYFPMIWRVFDASSFPPANWEQRSKVWGESLHILLTVALISGVTWSLGKRFRIWLGLEIADPWVRFGFNYGFGLLVFNLFWVGTGLLRLWYKPLWEGMAVLCVFVLALDVLQLLKARRSFSLKETFPRGPAYFFIVLVGFFYWTFSLLQGLSPETFYDSMVYHLAVPSYWLQQHGFQDFTTNFFSNFPYGAECYFLVGLALQGTESAKMLHVVSFGVCALLAGGWARELGGKNSGWITLGCTLTLPLFAVNTWTTQVEGFLALISLLFLYALARFVERGDVGAGLGLRELRSSPQHGHSAPLDLKVSGQGAWALAAGLFAGFAFSTKYTASLVAGSALVILVILHPWIFKRKYWGYWMVLVSSGFVFWSPWILKNLTYTDNPFFPYFRSFFPWRQLDQAGYDQLLLEQHARAADHWWQWLMLPWDLTMSEPNTYNFCGPFALAFIPFCFLFRIRQTTLRMLGWLTPILLVLGLSVTHILRFVVSDFVFFYILLGALVTGGDRPVWGKVVAWTGGLCALLCFVNLAAIGGFYYSCGGIWTGKQTRAQYLSGGRGKITPYYPMAQWIGENLPRDARLLVVGDGRGLYYDRSFLTDTVFDTQTLPEITKQTQDAEAIGRSLKEMGVDYLVINGLEGIRVSAEYDHYHLDPQEWARLDEFMQRGTEVVYDRNLQEVHRILPAFKEWPDNDRPDLLLFFSKQGTQYVRDAQERKVEETRKDLDEVLKLYPFSRFWKKQKLDFEKSVKAGA